MILAATHLLMVSALTPHLHMFFLQSKISNQSIIFSRYMLYHGLRYVSLQFLKLILTNIKTKPGWMKSSGSMNGGSLSSTYVSICEFIYLIAILLCITHILIFLKMQIISLSVSRALPTKMPRRMPFQSK